MGTPRFSADAITQLRALVDDFLEAHQAGGYADNSMRIRESNLNGFLLFLEGKYDPATEKGQRRGN